MLFFFFKQKTAYEMRISDWSSDVCSSDLASLLKAWNAVFMTAVRLLFAQGREGMIPAFFSSVNPKTGSPGKAVIAVAIFNCVGILLGKGLLEPIVNIMSICVAAIYVLICAATLVKIGRAHV